MSEGSWRRSPLPSNWATIRNRILRRDPTCRICGLAPSTEVDHVGMRDDHRDEKLRGVCRRCHKVRSETQRRAAFAARPKRKREPEKHPGIL